VTEIRTRDEALGAIEMALSQWESSAAGVLTQAAASVNGAKSAAQTEVRRWVSKVAALQAMLASLGPDDDARSIRSQLMHCERNMQSARQAETGIDAVAQQVSSLQRSQAQETSAQVCAARNDLSRRASELLSYRGSGADSGSGGRSSNGLSGGGGSAFFGAMGLSSVEVSQADFADNPIIGNFGRGGATRADYRWAVQTWDEVVGPGVARGMERPDFEARDTARGATPLRRTAAVYDMFLGDMDRIRLSRGPDGTLDVTNGRHRLEVARELGIRSLPGQVFG
jgi:hypothetical protein